MQIDTIANLKEDRHVWITIIETDFYPDYLDIATAHYQPVLKRFRELVDKSENSAALFRAIGEEPPDIRTQLQRVFRKYISPDTSVEMLDVRKPVFFY